MGKHRGIKILVLFTFSLAAFMDRFQNVYLGYWEFFGIIGFSFAISILIESFGLLITCSIKDNMTTINVGWRFMKYLSGIILAISLVKGIRLLITDNYLPTDLIGIMSNILTWMYIFLSRIVKIGDDYIFMSSSMFKISDIIKINKEETITNGIIPREVVRMNIEFKNGKKGSYDVQSKYEHNLDILLDRVESYL